ncbi:hypothetical protein FRB95_008205 [Tulasnella sp. JGI-2019a]|nr:hypothetical protein FRB95_008205 [Tulasnella sp. JGI-2019a]
MSNAQSTPDVSSPKPPEDLEFWGRPNEVVSRFLGAIMRAAVIQGRHSDEEWMVAYTESCLRGDALEWFDNMSADAARMEWSSLRKALLRRFHRPDSYMASPPPSAVATEGTVAAATEAVMAMVTAAVQKAEAVPATATARKNVEAATRAAVAAAVVAATRTAVAAATEAAVAVVAAIETSAAVATEAIMTATAPKDMAIEAEKETAVAGATEASMSRCRVKVVRGSGQALGYIPPPDRSKQSLVPVSSENALVLVIPKVCYGNQALAPIRMVAQSEAYPFLGIEKDNDVVWTLRSCRGGSLTLESIH